MDLKDLIEAFHGEKEIAIIQVGKNTKCIFEGLSNKLNCKKINTRL